MKQVSSFKTPLFKVPDTQPKAPIQVVPEGFEHLNTEFMQYMAGQMLGSIYSSSGMYCSVNWKWVKPLVEWIGNRKCLEVMAGRGFLSYALRELGVNVVATDDYSMHTSNSNRVPLDLLLCQINMDPSIDEFIWNGDGNNPFATVTEVEQLDAIASVEKYSRSVDIVIMSWPRMDDTAHQVLKTLEQYNPSALLLYIGEEPGGSCASYEFFEAFDVVENDEQFNKVSSLYVPWMNNKDRPLVGRHISK